MARESWNLWVVRDNRTEIRRYRVRPDLIRLCLAAGLLAVGLLGSAATRLFYQAEQSLDNRRLVRKATLLEAELDHLRTRIDTLHLSMETLAEQDDTYRLLAGLDPLDPDVRRVGIGGPGTETLAGQPLYGYDVTVAGKAFEASSRVDQLLRRARLLSFSWREAGNRLQQRYDELAATPSILPTAGTITSPYTRNRWHPILGKARPHLGIDIVAAAGSPVVAPARGLVSFVGRRGEYGLTVEIDHGSDRVTRFAHLSRILATLGQEVERGEVIGKVGSTGLAVGPHLHYEVLVDGRPMNPKTFILRGDGIPD